MKALEKHFIGRGEVKGFEFTQLKSSDRAYLYQVNSGHSIYYEVFKKLINKRFNRVSYPTSKAFGIWAWTIMSYDRAEEKFNQLNTCD